MQSRTFLVVGHGGQGVLDLGNFIAYDALLRGLHVAYTPSYGPETRGGKVRCYVVTSADEIDSPIVDQPEVLVAMNNPSMDFESSIVPAGILLMNRSLIDRNPTRQDIKIVQVPATEIADKLRDAVTGMSDTRVLQNSVMFGAILGLDRPFNPDDNGKRMLHVLEHAYTASKSKFIPANRLAMEKGQEFMVSMAMSRYCG